MGNQANILSFDEVKRDSGARRSSVAAPSRPSRRRPAGSVGQGVSAPVRTAGRSGSSSRYAAARPLSDAARISGTAPRTAPLANSARPRSIVDDFPASSARAAVTAYADRGSRVEPAGTAPRRSRGAHARQFLAEPDEFGERSDDRGEAEDEAPGKRSRLQEFRRKRQKDRADKKFDKQFGGSSRTSDAPAGSRAAVYKGEMGANHKRAARMQNDAAGKARTFSLASLNPLALLSSGKQSPKAIAGLGFVACLLLTCWFLYTPAQQLYHSVREHDRLQAEYAAIEQRNASLESEVGTLQTDAGIEDRAHEQFGGVPEGEQTANVHGLSADGGDEGSNFTANIVAGSVEAPETWYSPVLDALFGVK